MDQGERDTVLITGASSGIGLAAALYMAGKGYSVVGTSRSEEGLDALGREAANRGFNLQGVQLDVNDDEAVGEALPRIIAEHSGIEVLVNNAGYGLWGPIESVSMEQLRAQFETNFFAAVRMIKAVLPQMTRRRSGTIVNISSVLGRMGTPFNGAYVASKFALEGLSESMRVELWPLGVRVALVEPGLIRTRFHDNQIIGEQAHSADLPHSPYVQQYRRRRRRIELLGSDPVKVAKVVHKIVRSRRPRFRYPVNPEARAGMLATRLMPERLFQALMSRATMGT